MGRGLHERQHFVDSEDKAVTTVTMVPSLQRGTRKALTQYLVHYWKERILELLES